MEKIICLGKNFPDHAAELGEAQPEKPVVFTKFPSVLTRLETTANQRVALIQPERTFHHELEVVLKIGQGGFKIRESEARECIESVSVGLDLTDRDLQKSLKGAGLPWTIAKNFPHAALVGPFVPIGEFADFESTIFSLQKNGKTVQQATLEKAFFSPVRAITEISKYFPICDGDLIYLGTPTGVGPMTSEDEFRLQFGPLDFSFTAI